MKKPAVSQYHLREQMDHVTLPNSPAHADGTNLKQIAGPFDESIGPAC